MVDITLCINDECLIREQCRRSEVAFINIDGQKYFSASPQQSYSRFEQSPDGTCDYQLKIKEKEC